MATTTTTFYGLLLLALVIVAPYSEAAISCGQVAGSLSKCTSYVVNGGAIPPACCMGIKNLNNAAKTTPDRQTACRCIKSFTASIKGLKLSLAAGLPGKCNVNIPYAISPSTDCSKVR